MLDTHQTWQSPRVLVNRIDQTKGLSWGRGQSPPGGKEGFKIFLRNNRDNFSLKYQDIDRPKLIVFSNFWWNFSENKRKFLKLYQFWQFGTRFYKILEDLDKFPPKEIEDYHKLDFVWVLRQRLIFLILMQVAFEYHSH